MLDLRHIDGRVRDYFDPWMEITPDGVPILRSMESFAEPSVARQHFLFQTATDALSFCHMHPELLKRPGSNVFTVIGLSPDTMQVQGLAGRYPNARTVGVFDDDLCGRVLDCRVALWLLGRDSAFRLDDGEVAFTYRDHTFRIAEPSFSLHRFRTLTGLRSTYRTFKPRGAVSFLTMLAERYANQEIKQARP